MNVKCKRSESRTDGIYSKLRAAASDEEICKLLQEGREYPFASEKTRRRWERTAQKRKQELGS